MTTTQSTKLMKLLRSSSARYLAALGALLPSNSSLLGAQPHTTQNSPFKPRSIHVIAALPSSKHFICCLPYKLLKPLFPHSGRASTFFLRKSFQSLSKRASSKKWSKGAVIRTVLGIALPSLAVLGIGIYAFKSKKSAPTQITSAPPSVSSPTATNAHPSIPNGTDTSATNPSTGVPKISGPGALTIEPNSMKSSAPPSLPNTWQKSVPCAKAEEIIQIIKNLLDQWREHLNFQHDTDSLKQFEELRKLANSSFEQRKAELTRRGDNRGVRGQFYVHPEELAQWDYFQFIECCSRQFRGINQDASMLLQIEAFLELGAEAIVEKRAALLKRVKILKAANANCDTVQRNQWIATLANTLQALNQAFFIKEQEEIFNTLSMCDRKESLRLLLEQENPELFQSLLSAFPSAGLARQRIEIGNECLATLAIQLSENAEIFRTIWRRGCSSTEGSAALFPFMAHAMDNYNLTALSVLLQEVVASCAASPTSKDSSSTRVPTVNE